jgi:tetratricopeptide (TPR) repeat protein
MIVLSFLLIFGLVYSPVLYFDYLFHDDVFFWFRLEGGFKHPVHDLLMSMGRYTAAWLTTFAGWTVHDVPDLKFLRLLGLLGLSACAVLVFRQMRRSTLRDIHAFLAAIVLFLWPGFQDIIFYAAGSYCIWSVFLACLAFEIISGGQIFGGIGLILISLTIYPPGAMFYWVMAAMVLLFPQHNQPKPPQKQSYPRLICAGLAGLLLYAALIYGVGPLFRHSTPLPLYNIYATTHDLPGKLQWFFSEPLVNALNLWDIYPKAFTTFLVAFFIILTGGLAAMTSIRQAPQRARWDLIWSLGGKAGLILCLFLLAFLPNLAAGENAAFYRCLTALTSVIWLLLLRSCLWWIGKIPPAAGRWVMTVVLSSAVLYSGFKAFQNILYFRVYPSHLEWMAFKSMAVNIPFKATDQVYIICPNHRPAIERYDEFGVLTSQYSEDIFPLLYCAFQKPAGDPSIPTVKITFPDDFKINNFRQYFYSTRPDGQRVIQEIGSRLKPVPLNLNPAIRLGSRSDKGVINVSMPDNNPDMKSGVFILNLRESVGDVSFPNLAKAHYDRGVILGYQRNLEQALSEYNKAIELDPQFAEAYTNRGGVYYNQGHLAQAVLDYTKAIEINRGNVEAYASRAAVYYLLRQFDKAWADVQKAEGLGGPVNPKLISVLKASMDKRE